MSACGAESTDRQGEVARRGAEVMPFELDATTHHFDATEDGGVQVVVADDPDDEGQVVLVRRHLREEAQRFRRGDFGDPAAIHGHDMPGLAELQAGASEVEIGYGAVEAGARLTYTTDDPELVTAIHRWFEAQRHDHGGHASGD